MVSLVNRLLLHERFQALGGVGRGDAHPAVVQVDEDVAVVAHAQFLHVGKLAEAVTGLDALHEVVMLLGRHRVDDIDAGLVHGQEVGGRQDTHVGRNHRLGREAFAVTGDGHVAHHIDIGHVLAEMVDGGLGGLGHPLHELFLGDVPLVGLAGGGVDPGLAHAAVGAADADVLVAAAEAALGVALEMGQRHHGVIVDQMASHGHLVEPLAADDRQRKGVFLVDDVHRAEGPAIDLDGFSVGLRGVAVALVVGVRLDDRRFRQVLLDQGFHPFARDDVRAVLLAGVELDAHAALDVAAHFLIRGDESLGREITGEIDHGFLAIPLVVRDILVSILDGGVVGRAHGEQQKSGKNGKSFHGVGVLKEFGNFVQRPVDWRGGILGTVAERDDCKDGLVLRNVEQGAEGVGIAHAHD